MKNSKKLKKLLKEYPIIKCSECNDWFIYIPIVKREGNIRDGIRQYGTKYCPSCGSMIDSQVNRADRKRYNKKRLKIKSKEGLQLPISYFNKLPKDYLN